MKISLTTTYEDPETEEIYEVNISAEVFPGDFDPIYDPYSPVFEIQDFICIEFPELTYEPFAEELATEYQNRKKEPYLEDSLIY